MGVNATVHPTLPVSDLKRGRTFYEDVLGLDVFEENAEGIFFRAAEGTFLAIYPSSFAGSNRGTAAVFFVKELEAEVAALRSRGVSFEEYDLPGLKTRDAIAELGFYRAAWFKDPDGNVLGLFEKRR